MLLVFMSQKQYKRYSYKGLSLLQYNIYIQETTTYKCTDEKEFGCVFRSISCGQWRGRLHRTPACWSTSAGRWTGKPGWSHRSIRSTSSQVERWSEQHINTVERKVISTLNFMTQKPLQLSHLNLHGAWGKSSNFLLHTVSNTRVHGGTTGQHIVGVQVLTDVNVALHDAVVCSLMDTSRLHTWAGEKRKVSVHIAKQLMCADT